MSFLGKTVVVTGGASGIGRAVSEAFAARGARVVVADIDERRAAALAGTLGGGAMPLGIDVARVEEVEGALSGAAGPGGRIDVLVNNAAVFDMAPLLAVTPAGFDRLFAVNVRGFFFVMQAAARLMVADGRGGAIVNMASQAGRRGEAASAIYAATKAATISLTQSAALALIRQGVRVNAVAPGVVDTEMWDLVDRLHAEQLGREPGQTRREAGLAVPAGRMGRPDDIAATVVFLASPEAGYVVGQTINVDGGNVLS